MPETYEKAAVDEILRDTMAVIERLTAENISLTEENNKLATAQSGSSVELEKVATPLFSTDDLKEFVNSLVSMNRIEPGDAFKMASSLEKDPSQLLALAQKLASLSPPARSIGRGVDSTAYAGFDKKASNDPDGWLEVINEGVR